MKIYNARNLVTFRNIVVQVLLQVRIIIISVENCKSFTYKFDMKRLIIALNEIRQEKFKIKTPLNFALIQGQLTVLKTRQTNLSHLEPKRNHCSFGNGEVIKIPFKIGIIREETLILLCRHAWNRILKRYYLSIFFVFYQLLPRLKMVNYLMKAANARLSSNVQPQAE